MTTTPADFFNLSEADPVRKGGKPILIPEGMPVEDQYRVEYSRASGMAEFIEDLGHIHKWEMRYLAKAMGQNEDLAALAAVETYSTGISDAVFGRDKTMSGKRLDVIIDRAMDRARIHEKADRGTAVHGATEPTAPPREAIPERLRPPTDAFWDINRRECIELVGTEMFTANDLTMSAGTFDHLVRIPGHPLFKDQYVIGDKKTGRFDPFSWCVQLSTYGRGKVYDTTTDTRIDWPGPVNLDYGLVWQIDCDPDTKGERVQLWVVNLEFGWRMAQLAAQVRDGHEEAKTVMATEYRAPTFAQRLAASNTAEHLRLLWHSTDDLGQRALVEEKARSL